MGEVYRATDINLTRQVAIKVLPETFANDPERLARFEREAKTLASLNHPNIAQIYGFEKADGTRALVMEALAFKFRQCCQNVQLHLPGGRRAVDASPKRHERDADSLKLFEQRYEMAEVAPEPIQAPANEHVEAPTLAPGADARQAAWAAVDAALRKRIQALCWFGCAGGSEADLPSFALSHDVEKGKDLGQRFLVL